MADDNKDNPLYEEGSEVNPLTEENLPETNGQDTGEEGDGIERNTEVPEVAETNKAKNFIVLGAILVIGIIVLISLFTGKKAAPPQNPLDIPGNANNNNQVSDSTTVPSVPENIPSANLTPPAPPAVETSIAPPPAVPGEAEVPVSSLPPLPAPGGENTAGNNGSPAPPAISAPSQPTVNNDEQKERLNAKMLIAGAEGPGNNSGGSGGGAQPKQKLPEISEARVIGDTTNMIAQGKIIDAVLETAINTDLPGVLRAIVSRDIYAESGRNILIPKGSRLVGAYNAEIKRGQARVYIIWNRVLRPDGIDIQLDSPGADRLGRTGLPGRVDSKYLEIFGNAILFSTLDYAFAAGAESVTGSQGVQETQNPNGGTTVSGKASDQALSQSIQNFGTIVKGVGSDLVNVRPTITIDQGTVVKVFVNRDLKFNQDEDKNILDLFK